MSERAARALRRSVLVDSSAYFALVETRDVNHRQAQAIAHTLAEQRWRLFTTNFVLAEAHALILSRRGRSLAARFLTDLAQSQATVIIRARAADEQRAREVITQYDDKDFSLTDAIRFAVMERLDIVFAFSFDHHFAQYGVAILSPALIR
jgi:predicted nucleic acid-binding protein